MPKRIKRKRTKGWKMPPNTVYVGRPSKWGNSFKVEGDILYQDASYRRKILNRWVFVQNYPTEEEALKNCLRGYEIATKVKIGQGLLDLSELKGKNLACWCPLDKPCHADILLKLANE